MKKLLTILFIIYLISYPYGFSFAADNSDETLLIDLNRELPEKIYRLSISPDNSEIALASFKSIYVYSIRKRTIRKLKFKGKHIENILYSDNQAYLGISDFRNSTLYDLNKDKAAKSFKNYTYSHGTPSRMYFSVDCRYFILLSYVTFIYDIKENKNNIVRVKRLTEVSDVTGSQTSNQYYVNILTDWGIKKYSFTGNRMTRISYKNTFNKTLDDKAKIFNVVLPKYLFYRAFSADGKSVIGSSDNFIGKLNIDSLKDIKIVKPPTKMNYLFGHIKENRTGKLFYVTGTLGKVPENRRDFLCIFDSDTLKLRCKPIPISHVSWQPTYDIAPSGNFVVYIRNGKLFKYNIKPADYSEYIETVKNQLNSRVKQNLEKLKNLSK